MTDVLIVGGLVGEVAGLLYLDHRLYRTWFTPVAMLGVPYAGAVIITWLTAPLLGFIPLHMESILYWMAGLLLFWGAGAIVGVQVRSPFSSGNEARGPLPGEHSGQVLSLVLAWLIMAVLVLHFRTSLSAAGGWTGFGSEAFELEYGYGFAGHLLTLLIVLLMFLIGISRSARSLTGITIAAGFVFVVFYQVKTWIFIPLLAGMLYRIATGRWKLSVRRLAALAALFPVFFFGVYLVGFGGRNPAVLLDGSMYRFLARHLMSYLYSGVLTFGETVRGAFPFIEHDPVSRIFTGFVNIFRYLSGREYVSFLDPNYVTIDTQGVYTSNVHTLFGALLIYLGWAGALVYVLYMGAIIYLLFAIARRSGNCWIMVIWCCIAATLVFGWFDLYFWHLVIIVELPAYCLLMAVLSAILERAGYNRSLAVPALVRDPVRR